MNEFQQIIYDKIRAWIDSVHSRVSVTHII